MPLTFFVFLGQWIRSGSAFIPCCLTPIHSLRRSERFSCFMNAQNSQQNSETVSMLGFAWELGYSIALPLAAFALAGRYADRQWETSPVFLLLGMGCAVAISAYSVYRKVKRVLENISKEK